MATSDSKQPPGKPSPGREEFAIRPLTAEWYKAHKPSWRLFPLSRRARMGILLTVAALGLCATAFVELAKIWVRNGWEQEQEMAQLYRNRKDAPLEIDWDYVIPAWLCAEAKHGKRVVALRYHSGFRFHSGYSRNNSRSQMITRMPGGFVRIESGYDVQNEPLDDVQIANARRRFYWLRSITFGDRVLFRGR